MGATLLLVAAFISLVLIRDRPDAFGAYLGFTCGVLIWGWLEMTYFMNVITGPHKQPCPPHCSHWRRFWLAIQTSLYHELAIIIMAIFILIVSHDQINQIGAWAFCVLWWMRWSAKLNLFLGVLNLNEEWLPMHLRFLSSYVPKRAMNLLFPISVTVATVMMSLLIEAALDYPPGSFATLTLLLTATLVALGILEHWFLMLPVADSALWSWWFTDDKSSHHQKM
jgi:putative photosynthetic complex assembly protein 2